MAEASRKLDRRKFINGHWSTQAGDDADLIEIASILVQTRPERLGGVVHAIEALPDTQIFCRDPKGKIVVVLEASNAAAISETLGTISALPGVLTASLVFHATDEG